MGILLVTAYNGMRKKGRRDGNIQSYSKYLRRPRVRTASGGALPVFLVVVRLIDAASGSSSQHALPEAAGDRLWNNRIV